MPTEQKENVAEGETYAAGTFNDVSQKWTKINIKIHVLVICFAIMDFSK